MNFSIPLSTPKRGLSATRQASRESGASQDFCGGTHLNNVKSGRSPQSTQSGEQIARHEKRKAQPQAKQLSLWELPQQKSEEFALQKHQKPQISSITGISPKQRAHYRVVLGDEILGERLSLDEALRVVKGEGEP